MMSRVLYVLSSLMVLGGMLAACVTPVPVPSAANTSAETPAEMSTEEHAHADTVLPVELPALAAVDLSDGRKLQVVATTNIVADVVAQVAVDHIDLYDMLPVGADPHSYQLTPQDLRALTDADVVFVNGMGLEEAMSLALEDFAAKTVVVNTGISAIEFGEDGHDHTAHAEESEEEHAEEHADEHAGETEHAHEGLDPHTWFSVHAVEQWTHNIAHVLSDLDPANAEAYEAAAQAYAGELDALHAELTAQVDAIPAEARKLVTDHHALGYLAAEYGFEVVGTVIPSFSTLAEPSAQQLAALQEQIRAESVRAIFVGTTVNPRQETQLAADLGIRVVPIYTGSLSEPNGPAGNYIEFMRYNVSAIVEALGAD